MKNFYKYLFFIGVLSLGILYQDIVMGQNENVLLSEPVTYYLNLKNPPAGLLELGIPTIPGRTIVSGSSPIGAGNTFRGQTNYTPELFFYVNGSPAFSEQYCFPVDQNWILSGKDFPQPYTPKGSYQIKMMYVMIAPNPVQTDANNYCGDTKVTLRSPLNWDLFPLSYGTASVEWQYSIGSPDNWIDMPPSEFGFENYYNYTFIPVKLFPQIASGITNIKFRCRAKAVYSAATCYSPYSAGTNVITFLPPGPAVDASQKVIVPACPGQPTGTITIPASAIVSGFTGMRWILRKGNNPAPCDPGLSGTTSACGDQQDWSGGVVPVSGGIFSKNIPKGDYTLWVINPSQNAGNCFTPIPITMPELNELTISLGTTSNISCFGGNDGAISVTAAEGNGANSGYFFTLKKDGVVFRSEQRAATNTMTWTGLPAGVYTAEVHDGTCAPVKSVGTTLSQPDQVKGEVFPTAPTCASPGNGSIAVVADPGITNYKYNLYKDGVLLQQTSGIPSPNYTFSGLVGGNYTVEILNNDKPSCPGWSTATSLNVVPALTLSMDARSMVTCASGNDGSLQYSATGGSGGFIFTLTKSGGSPVSNSNGIFSALTAGSYTIKVQNSVPGCNDVLTQTVSITEPLPLQVSLQKTDITCNDARDGMVKATVSGGSGFYQYKWEQLKGGVWVTDPFWYDTDTKIDALASGTYRVTVSDSKSTNCSLLSNTVTITELPALQSGGVTIKEAVCLADGATVTISATGGDNSYTYAWTLDGTNYTTFTSGTALHTPGSYYFRIKDGKGCTLDLPDPSVISLPATALAFTTQLSSFNGFNISCNGAADGKITILATGGNGGAYTGYLYKLDNGAYQSGNVFSNLSPGTYTLSVKDARGCVATGSVTLIQPNLSISATHQDIDCYGLATGSITTSIQGGATPYKLYVNGTLVAGTTINNLAQGTYALHLTDANGCSKDTTIVVNYRYPALNITTATVTDIRCFGRQGNIALGAAGGDGVYQYSLSNDNWATSRTYSSGAGIDAGVYALKVADGHGCSLIYNNKLTLTAPPAVISFSATLSDYNGHNISCAGGNNGTAQIAANGGNGSTYNGYTYALDNGTFAGNPMFTGIKAGQHTLKVQDGRGCVASQSYTFTESAQALSVQLVSKQDVPCAAIPAGSITVAGSGGTGSLQYSIDNTNWNASPVFTGLMAGDYIVTVRDANTCGISLPVKVASLNVPIVIDNVTRQDIVCFGTAGAIQVQAHGGTGGLTYEYALNGGAYTSFNNNTPLGAGNYTVRVKDAAGCYSPESGVLGITAPAAPLSATISTSDYHGMQVSCYGLTDGEINLTTSGGNGGSYQGYQYSVNSGAYTNNAQYKNIGAGNYTIKVRDGRGCEITKNIVLQQPSAPLSLVISDIAHLPCGGSPTGKITLQAAGGTLPYQYTLNNGAPQPNGVFTTLPAGNYALQVKDVNGCAASATTAVTAMFPPVTATATVTAVRCNGDANGSVVLQPVGGDGSYNYEWSSAGLNGAQVQQLKAGNYAVKITDGKGCSQSYSYEVTQPPLLAFTVTGSQICDGIDDGTITTTVQGGTTPYQYALGSGNWGSDNVFGNLTAGDYTVKVQDAKGCGNSQQTTITKRNVKPDANFLVASRKNAYDTLVIKEISLPAPDFVSWTFDPQAILLGYDRGTPLIKFTSPGTYWVEMKGTFGECNYKVRKDIQISDYDPLAGPSNSLPVRVIDTVMLSPNPNDGNFRFQIKMSRKQQVIVSVFDLNGRVLAKQQYSPALMIDDRLALGNANSGIYILRVVAENESRDVRFIVNR
ncbi:T9SS type A sorting domain-containing protein [Chitinophaga sp. HK235]|uniref:T9SS type A sorting domain-containing protein n=1 Tax=Chitinophaga sp. HK235 TaxID=2952571 RepID=UPI001BA994B6|nr:T9SS type A sorting domain-containing protein [Chitinophaga sp. HK235]